jgi:branched-chain amino acid transport system substrate-binding protein
MSPNTPLNRWFFDGYSQARGVWPVQAAYRITQGLLGMKVAIEKAMAANGGKKPTPEEIAAALENSEWESPGGLIQMKLGNGHQAIQPMAIGRTRYDAAKKMVVLEDIQNFASECVNPPANMKSLDWIKAGFPGAKCDGGS